MAEDRELVPQSTPEQGKRIGNGKGETIEMRQREDGVWEHFFASGGEGIPLRDYFFTPKGESEPSFSEYFFEPSQELGKQKTDSLGLGIIRNGIVQGAVGAALAGGLIGMKELGEIWKEYGKENFPLDPFTRRGRGAMKKQYYEIKNAFAQIGR